MHCLASSSSLHSLANFNSQPFPSVFFVVDSTRSRIRQNFKAKNLVAVEESGSLWGSFKKGLFYNGRILRRCKDWEWDSEADFSLETEILEFMDKSNKPEAFPTKRELVDAGRLDLVDAILKKGGWLASGWDLDKHDIQGNDETRFSVAGSSFSSSAFSSLASYSQPAFLSARPAETKADESGSGIEGILSRLENERSNAFVLGFREKEDSILIGNNEEKDEWHQRNTTEDQKSSSDELQKLSDDWEFLQNKIMNAQNRLRSLCAKLAILEGKTELALSDAHKIVEEKQRRFDSSHKALQFLKTTYVVWPNTASEVLLTGSFDGWSTQRKMEKSSTGIFSVCLHLYPGKYEIKFIVDGEWRIDPLRPIADNKDYKNNLLIVK